MDSEHRRLWRIFQLASVSSAVLAMLSNCPTGVPVVPCLLSTVLTVTSQIDRVL